MIKAIIFDMDDTLYNYQDLNLLAMDALATYTSMQLGISRQEFDDAFTWAKKETKKILKTSGSCHNRIIYCQKTLEYLHVNPISISLDMYEIYWKYILDHMQLNLGVKEVLQFCKKNQIRIGICTDLTTYIQHKKLKKLGISTFVDAIVTSEEAGNEKPNPLIFSMLLDKLGIYAEEVLYVGDSLEKDIIGAESVGISALWYTPKLSDKHASIQNFFQLLKLLELKL